MSNKCQCWLCGRNGAQDPLDTHHIFGGPLRDKSDRYGLTVTLCHNRCHIFGKDSAHQNRETAMKLRKYGQRKAMIENGWNERQFALEFGKNWLDEDEIAEITAEQKPEKSSFCALNDGGIDFFAAFA